MSKIMVLSFVTLDGVLQTLLKHDLVDPKTSFAGVILATYKRAGDIQTGSL